MENEFKSMLLILKNLNNHKMIIPSNDLEKEYENIRDLEDLNEETLKYLEQLKIANNLSIDELLEQLCFLNTQLSTYIWHTESMRDILQKFIYYERFKI
jgi:hypothetical protein